MAQREGSDLLAGVVSPFVGRDEELQLFGALLDRAFEGLGKAVLVEGEAGIGKTRLAEEVADVARGRGVGIFWGRCWEGEGAPAFWPWIQIVRALIEKCDPNELRSIMGPGAADLVQLVPTLRDLMPDMRPLPEPLEPGQARFRLFDSIAVFLRRWTQACPALFVLDDLHWADTPSLRLMQFVLQEMYDCRLLILATFRDDKLSQHGTLAEIIPDLMRARTSVRLRLRGLNRGDVAELFAATTGMLPTENLTTTIVTETDGNPLFVTEIVRAMVFGGLEKGDVKRPLRVPDSLREALMRRLRQLSPECVNLLQTACVAGRQFELRVVEQAMGGERVPADIVEEACNARIIEETPEGRTNYRFTHVLMQEAVYDELTEGTRRQRHIAIGRAIEEVSRGELDEQVAALAFHFFRALPDCDADKAVRYGTRAAERATRLLAHEDAVDHYRRTLVAERSGSGDVSRRCEILLALGYALTRAGDVVGAKDVFAQAVEVARAAALGEQLARAALGICGLFPATETADPLLRHLLEEVLAALDGSVNGLHAKVLSAASSALHVSWSGAQRIDVSRRALQIARTSGDVRAELHALDARYYAFLSPTGLEERFVAAREQISLADTIGDKEMSLRGHLHLVTNYLDACNLVAADLELDTVRTLSGQLRQPSYRWQVLLLGGMRALLAGRFEEAAELSSQARMLGEKWGDPRVLLAFWSQQICIKRDVGTLDEIEAMKRLSVIPSGNYAWDSVLVLLLAEIGRCDDANKLLELWKLREFQPDAFSLTALSVLAAASAIVDEPTMAPILYEKLRPYRGRGVTPGLGAPVFLGVVDFYLGMLAAVMRDSHRASDHLLAALRVHVAIGARPLSARTRLEYGKVLVQLGQRDEGRAQIGEAISEFEALGMGLCLQRARRTLAELEEERSGTVGGKLGEERGAVDATHEAVFRSDGDYWTVSFAGRTARIKNVRGLHYIAYLLARANQPVYALDLAVLGMQPGEIGMDAGLARQESLQVADFGGQGVILDERARAEYRGRLRELAAEREEVERLNDYGHLARIDEEIEAIESYLSAGSGREGRMRRWTSPAERARVNVRNSIAKALRTIAQYHEPLHRHLQNSIKTGAVCSYAPEQGVGWQITGI